MLSGVNIRIHIGAATVMHDERTQMMFKTGEYCSSDAYPSLRDSTLKREYEEYKKQHLGR